jgi:NitT/TauT family transport system substrate-binding protein
MNRLFRGLLRFGLLLALVGGVLGVNAQSDDELDSVTVITIPRLSFMPLYFAEAEGYFTEQGIAPEFIQVDSTATALPVLLTGEVDVFAGTITVGMFNAIARDGGIRIVADKGQWGADSCTYTALLTRPEVLEYDPINDAGQLRLLRFGARPANYNGYLLDRIFAAAGVTVDDLAVEDMSSSVRAEAIINGAVDAIQVSEPWITRILQESDELVVWAAAEDYVPELQFGFVMYGSAFLEDDPELGERFMAAYLQGARQYNEGATERNLDIMEDVMELDRDLLAAMCFPDIAADGAINVDAIIDFQQWALDRDLLDRIVTADEFWEVRFADAAVAILDETES